MGKVSSIEWTEATWNPVAGCSVVSPGCHNCYARNIAARFSKPGQAYHGLAVMTEHGPQWTGEMRLVAKHLADPLRWREPKMVFVNSTSDLFHEGLTNEEIAAVFGVMAACPRHTFQVLTKRAKRMRQWFEWVAQATAQSGASHDAPRVCNEAAVWALTVDEMFPDKLAGFRRTWPLPNVWLGVSVEDQKRADDRILDLLETPAAVRFVSYEPALGPVDFTAWLGGDDGHPEECGGFRLSSGDGGGIGDRPDWRDLESCGAPRGSLERRHEDNPMQEASSGTRRAISERAHDGRRSPDDRAGSPPGLAALHGAHSGRDDCQSQERHQERQPPRESGASDALGADAARRARARVQPDPEPARLSWIIVGGESGPGSRPFDIEWARSTVEQCKSAGVACFVKQLGAQPHDSRRSLVGGWSPGDPEPDTRLRLKDRKGGDPAEWPEDLRVREFPNVTQ